jgi:hypothetical protein
MNIWTRLGVSVAISAGFYILMTEVLQKTHYFETHKWFCTLALLGGGLLLWLLGTASNRKVSSAGATPTDQMRGGLPSADSESAESVSGGFLSLRYAGFMLMLFGVITLVITPSHRKTLIAAARSMTVRTNSPAGSRSVVPLKLQGVILAQANPSAIINGSTCFVGDKIGQAKVVAITMCSVTLSFGDAEQVLRVPDVVDRPLGQRTRSRR